MTPDVVNWTKSKRCVACHRQGAALFGLATARKNGYSVNLSDSNGLGYVAQFIAGKQRLTAGGTQGYWDSRTNTSYAFFGLAGYDAHVSTSYSDALVRAANWAVARQDHLGRWPEDHGSLPTTYSNVPITARMMVGIAQAKQRVDANTANTYQQALDRAAAYLRVHKNDGTIGRFADGTPYNFQIAWAIIGLKAAGVADVDGDLLHYATRLLDATSFRGRGWGYTRNHDPDPFNTGMSIYALCLAGVDASANPALLNAIDWLTHTQSSGGSWGSGGKIDLFTTFAMLGLGCYGDYGVNMTVVGDDSYVIDAGHEAPQTVTYAFDVENHGFLADSYAISVQGSMQGWTTSVSPQALSLAPGEHGAVELTVTAPPGLPPAFRLEMTVVATSAANPDVSASARVTTYTNPPPPTTGKTTTTQITAGANATVTLGQSQTLAGRITDTVAGATVTGPGKGVATFYVGGIVVGTDTDADGDGVWEVDWSPDYGWTAIGDQDYRIIYSGIDLGGAGNLLPSLSSSTITVVRPPDDTPPEVTLHPLPQYTNVSVLPISGNVYDADSGIGSVVVLIDGEQHGDALVPDADGNVTATIPLSEGANTVVLQVTDRAGNRASDQGMVILDTIAPAVSFTTLANGQTVGSSIVDVGVSVSDLHGVAVYVEGELCTSGSGTVSCASSVALGAEGPNTITVSAVDVAGNQTTETVTVVLDLTSPVVSLDFEDGTIVGGADGNLFPITLHCDDLTATTVVMSDGTVYHLPAGGGVVQHVFDLSEGSNAISATVTDAGGHTSTVTSTVIYDATPPTGSFTMPPVASGTFDLVIEASDSITSVSTVNVVIDDMGMIFEFPAVLGPDGNWHVSIDTTQMPDCVPHISVVIVDEGGNTTVIEDDFVLDNTPPEVAITAPAPGTLLGGTIEIEAVATDATSGLAWLTVVVNGTPIGSCASSPCQLPFDTHDVPDGVMEIVAIAEDVAGNQAAAAETVVVDNTPPEVTILSPTAGAVVSGSFEVAVDVVDAHFATVECSVDGQSLGVSNDADFSQIVSTLDLLDGVHEVHCVAVDQLGHVGEATSTFTVQNWTLDLRPDTLNLGSKGKQKSVTEYIEGPNVALLLPVTDREITLRVPGGAPVPMTMYPGSRDVGDENGNGVPDLTLKFDRQALIASIRAGIAAGAIDPSQPLAVYTHVDGAAVGMDVMKLVD